MRKWLVGLLAAGLCAASAWATDYTLVTSTDDLTAGNYVITGNNPADGAEPAMTTQTPDKNYFYPANVAVDQGVISDPDDSLVWEVAEATGGWSIHSSVGFVQYSGSGNTANAEETVSDNSTWTISIAEGVATVFNVATADRKLQYNSGSPRFACYTSNQKGLKFYKASDGPTEFSIKLNPAEEFEVVQGKSASITATVKGAQGDVTYSWSVDGTPIDLSGNVYEINAEEVGGPFEVKCEADDGVSTPVSASVKYSVIDVPPVTGDEYTLVSSVDELQDGTLVVLTDPDSASALKAAVASSVFSVADVKDAVVDKVLTTDDASIVWKLVDDGKGNFSLYNEEAAKYAGHAGTDSNSGRLQEDLFPNAISVGDDGLFVLTSITADAKGAYRSLQYNYNSGNPRFAYYKGTQKNLRIYAAESGPATFSIKLDPASYFEVEVGEEASIAATPKNAEGDVHYAWTVGGESAGSDSAVLGLDTTAATEVIEVVCTATDGANSVATAGVSYKVVAPAPKFQVGIAIGIPNGSVSADKTEAEEGEEVTLSAQPAAGYKLVTFLLDGEAISGDTFKMPARDVLVSAEFEESTGVVYTLVETADEFEEGAEYLVVSHKADTFTSALKNEANGTRIALQEVTLNSDGKTIETDLDTVVWQIKAGAESGQYVLYNEAASVYAAAPKSAGNNAQLVTEESDPLAQWTLDFSALPAVKIFSVSYADRYLQRNSSASTLYFAAYSSAQATPSLYKKAGPATFTVTLDKADGFTVELGKPDSITATAKNGSGDYSYAWTGDLTGDAATLEIPATLAAGTYTVKVTATDNGADAQTAEKSISFSVVAPAPKFQVGIAIGIPNGSVSADKTEAEEGEEVTLSAQPAAGYKLVTFLLDGEAISGDTFKMPGHDVLVSAEFEESTGVVYTLVETADEFEEGAEYLVVSHVKDKFTSALKNEANGSRIALEEVALNADGKTIETDLDTVVWQIKAGAETGQYVLYNEAASVYAAAPKSAGNNAQLVTEESDPLAQWTLDFSALPAVKIFSVSYTDRYLQRNSSTGTLYFAAYASAQATPSLYKKAGPATFTVTLDKADGFTVELGKPDSITATAKNGSGDYSYAWTGDLTGDAATLEIPATLAAGNYTVKVTATDNGADAQTAEKSISFSVVAPAPKFQVGIAIGIPNGSVSADKTEAEEGEEVTLSAQPAEGYKLVTFLLDGEAISGSTFNMPAHDVLVSAEFEEFTLPPYYFQFETGKPAANSYKDADADVVNTGSTATEIPTVNFTLQRTGRGGDDKDLRTDTYALRMGPTNEAPAFFYNTKAFAEDITGISFQYGIYGTDKCEGFTVSTSADGSEWNPLVDLTESAVSGELKTYTNEELPSGVRYIRFDATSAQKSNVRRLNIDEIQLWTGAPAPKVVYSGETTITAPGTFDLSFELKNYDGTCTWSLDPAEGYGAIDADGHYTWEVAEATRATITVSALDATGAEIASAEVALTANEPGPQPGEPAIVIDGPASGVVGTELSCTVTAINMEDPTVYFEGNYGAPEGSRLTTDGIVLVNGVCTFTPDVAGDYWIEFCAYDGDAGICDKWTVTVTDEPGPQPTVYRITKLTKTGDNLVLTYEPEGTPEVVGTASLLEQDWTTVEGAVAGGTTATVPMGAQRYITLK